MIARRGLLLAVLALAACQPQGDSGPATGARAVAVQGPAELEGSMAPLLRTYQQRTGVRVDAKFGDSSGDAHTALDLLLFAGEADAVAAAADGLLRPVASDVLPAAIPAALRDPDGAWLALAWQPIVLAYDVRTGINASTPSFAELASPEFGESLCLASFAAPGRRELVASLIEAMGRRPAERVVRGWLANLAAPVFDGDDALLAAVVTGKCKAAIVLRPFAASPGEPGTGVLRYSQPTPVAGKLLAAGVARHAARPDAALELLAWLAGEAPMNDAARNAGSGELPSASPAATGWLEDDAVKLAERAGYR